MESRSLWKGLNFLCEIEINEHVLGSRNSRVNKSGQITERTDSVSRLYRCTSFLEVYKHTGYCWFYILSISFRANSECYYCIGHIKAT